MSDGILALIGALAGGSVLKLVEAWLNRGKQKAELEAGYRDELRQDIAALKNDLLAMKKDVETAQAESDQWREKYFKAREELAGYLIKITEQIKDGKS
jgi:hypothetical protein